MDDSCYGGPDDEPCDNDQEYRIAVDWEDDAPIPISEGKFVCQDCLDAHEDHAEVANVTIRHEL